MKKILRKNMTQILRFIIQIISLIFFSGMFVYIFAGIEQLFKYIVKGNISFLSVSTYFATLFITFAVTILFGRFFCGWICSFGAVFSYLNKLVKRVFKFEIIIGQKVDNYLKFAKYIIVFLIVIFIWTLNYNILKFSPWDAFSELIAFSPAVVSYKGGLIILSFIFIISIFIERAFCRYFCPLGALFAITSKLRILKIKKKSNNCGNCMICTNKCEMGLPLNKIDEVKSGECINCFNCISSCPRNNQEVVVFDQPINKNLAGAVTIASLLGVYTLMNTVSLNAENHKSVNHQQIVVDNSSSTQTIQNNNTVSNINDSYNNDTESNKTQNNSTTNDSIKITNGEITNNNGNASQQQNQDYNSNSINTSEGQNQSAKSSKTQNINTSSDNDSKANNNSKKYKDGTYTGEGIGYRPGIVVEVTIKDDKITKIEIVSDNETPRFSYLPFQIVPQEIIQSQSTNVDTVSGATMSSEGIIMAVEDALSKAKINQN